MITAIVAIILSIAGFFGFKSMSEIREKAIEEANSVAIKTSSDEFTRTFGSAYKETVFNEATEAMNNFLRKEIEDLQNRIAELERIPPGTSDDITHSTATQQEEDNTDPFE
jgi:hypothetical protein